MNQREIVVEPFAAGRPRSWYRLSSLAATLAGLFTTVLVHLFQGPLFGMIVLNGMVGTALLVGAMRYREQKYNLEGARSFLAVIASLAVFALIMPDPTKTEPDPSPSPFQAGLFGAITILFYAIFLAIRTMRHRSFFAEPVNGKGRPWRISPPARHGHSGHSGIRCSCCCSRLRRSWRCPPTLPP